MLDLKEYMRQFNLPLRNFDLLRAGIMPVIILIIIIVILV